MVLDWLKKAWAVWKKFGQFIGDVVGRVALTVLYFTIVLPFGLGTRFFSDPLAIKRARSGGLSSPPDISFWHARPELKDSVDEARRQ